MKRQALFLPLLALVASGCGGGRREAPAPEPGAQALVRELDILLDGAAFDAALESLVNLSETWRRLLEDFRPAAEAAAEAEAEDGAAFSASSGGFLQV